MPEYSVRISVSKSGFQSDVLDYVLTMLNAYGSIAERVSDVDLKDEWPESYDEMKALCNSAR